jgi:outer membrane lipoprotein-sorting protein
MRYILSILVTASCAYGACAPAPATRPATQPAKEFEISEKARNILNRLEMAGVDYNTLRANTTYIVTSPMTGDTETRTGWVAFQKGRLVDKKEIPTKFRVSFDTQRLGRGPKTKEKVDYLFDGNWLTIAKHKIKSMTKIQIAGVGEKVNAFKIGEGPFPVPFGQKTDHIIPLLEATTRDPIDSDPKNTDYIKLVPRRHRKGDVNFVRMEIWVDRKSNLPVKLVSKDHNKSITTVSFDDTKTQATLEPDLFKMKKPSGWDVVIKRKQQNK